MKHMKQLLFALSFLVFLTVICLFGFIYKDWFHEAGFAAFGFSTSKYNYSSNFNQTPQHEQRKSVKARRNYTQIPKILLWTTMWGVADFFVGLGTKPYRKANCSVICENTNNKNEWNNSDAVVFHPMDSVWPLPPGRPKHQKWIFYMLESPILASLGDHRIDNIFNWTMTYHRDSSIWTPYGRYFRRSTPVPMQLEPIKRLKTAAWMVSHCNSYSGRNELYDKLSKLISTTQYGRCNNNPCPNTWLECIRSFRNQHYFYLSWENSLCDDYVTEKLWNALIEGIVPVVYGGANYEQLLPPHSFIDATRFSNVKELADYLIYLSNNITAYQEYLQWSEHYEIDQLSVEHAWCEMCERLYDEREEATYSAVENAVHFWSVGKSCTRKEGDMKRLLHN